MEMRPHGGSSSRATDQEQSGMLRSIPRRLGTGIASGEASSRFTELVTGDIPSLCLTQVRKPMAGGENDEGQDYED